MEGPGLIIHLIREHGFFEGLNSPYRVDPIDVNGHLKVRGFGQLKVRTLSSFLWAITSS
jgi:hypothetical protein